MREAKRTAELMAGVLPALSAMDGDVTNRVRRSLAVQPEQHWTGPVADLARELAAKAVGRRRRTRPT